MPRMDHFQLTPDRRRNTTKKVDVFELMLLSAEDGS